MSEFDKGFRAGVEFAKQAATISQGDMALGIVWPSDDDLAAASAKSWAQKERQLDIDRGNAFVTFFGPFTSEREDKGRETIVQAGLEWPESILVGWGPGPLKGPDIVAPAQLSRGTLPDGTPATFCRFDVPQRMVRVLRLASVVPTIIGKIVQREGKTITQATVESIALVPRKESINPDCDMWVVDSDGNRIENKPHPVDIDPVWVAQHFRSSTGERCQEARMVDDGTKRLRVVASGGFIAELQATMPNTKVEYDYVHGPELATVGGIEP